MNKPKMVLFDYGNTLIHEDPFDALAGFTLLLEQYAVSNPCGVTAGELCKYNDEIYDFLGENAHCRGVEVHHHCMFRALFDQFRLEFSVPFDRLETVYWDASAPGRAAPGAMQVLEHLKSCGIRTGVVSNMSFSRAAMITRLENRLPGCDFDFVITSSEYGVRKPEELLFRAAIGLSGLSAGDIWFCGDSPVADVVGCSRVGMYPVLYRHPDAHPETDTDFSDISDMPHLYITHWNQFVPALENAD